MSEGTVNLYNPHDGLTGRDGGPYLDNEERRLAEIRRAAIEDREPEFDKAPATAGTPLVTGPELMRMVNPASTPSQYGTDPAGVTVDILADSDESPVVAFSQREKTDDELEAEKKASEPNPANPTIVSQDIGSDSDVLAGLETPTDPEGVKVETAKKTAAPKTSSK